MPKKRAQGTKRKRVEDEADKDESAIETRKPSAESLLPSTRLLGQDLFTVRVGKGEDAQVNRVHKNLLSKRSAFFDAAINGAFREATQQEVVLEEEDPLTLEFFLTWVYTSSLPTITDFLEIPLGRRDNIEDILLDLHAMADRLIAPDLQILTYQRLRELLHTMVPTPEWVEALYSATDRNSQLTKYVVMTCVHSTLTKGDNRWDSIMESNESLASDVARTIAGRGNHKIHPYDLEEYRELRNVSAMRAALTPSGGVQRYLVGNMPNRDFDEEPHPLIKKILDKMDLNVDVGSLDEASTHSTKWPHDHRSTSAMRAAGFYYSPENDHDLRDQVKCICCCEKFSGWEEDHRPFRRHRKQNPNCIFVEAVEKGLEPPLLPYF